MGRTTDHDYEGGRSGGGGVYGGRSHSAGYPLAHSPHEPHGYLHKHQHRQYQPQTTPPSLTIDSHVHSTPRQLPSPIPPEYTPKSFTSLSVPSARSTAHTHSLSTSPMRSSLGNSYSSSHSLRHELDLDCMSVSSHALRQRLDGVQLTSTSLSTQQPPTASPKLPTSLPSHLVSTHPSHQASSLPPSQLVSSLPSQLPSSLPLQQQASTMPSQLAPVLPPQQLSPAGPCASTQLPPQAGGLAGAAVGITWHSVPGSSYTQHVGSTQSAQQPPSNLSVMQVNQYSSQSFVNGQINHSMHLQQNFQSSPSHIQYSNMDYSGAQQQHYHNFDQLQSFPQNSGNYQFNIDYVVNNDSQSMYQDYYYGDYQYSDNYCSLGENFLDPNQLSVSAVRSTTPYGDETVDDLGPEEVRWFYKVEADKKWTPFIGYDSLRIEWKYRDLLQDVGAEGNESPAGEQKWSGKSSPKDKQDGSPQDVDKIVVRGGLYEVDVKQLKCESIYWQGRHQSLIYFETFIFCVVIASYIMSLYST